jgi:hypothetical protein
MSGQMRADPTGEWKTEKQFIFADSKLLFPPTIFYIYIYISRHTPSADEDFFSIIRSSLITSAIWRNTVAQTTCHSSEANPEALIHSHGSRQTERGIGTWKHARIIGWGFSGKKHGINFIR